MYISGYSYVLWQLMIRGCPESYSMHAVSHIVVGEVIYSQASKH